MLEKPFIRDFERKMAEAAAQMIRTMRLREDHVIYDGSVIPAARLRCCGPEFKSDSYYVKSAEKEAKRLLVRMNCRSSSKVLDIGCGQGRLPIGILREIGELDYTGLDVDPPSIEWCERHIQSRHPSFKFHFIDTYNERYNRSGRPLDESFEFDFPNHSLDIIYLYSVFSHMHEREMRIYLSDFRRILTREGRVFFTAFVEDDVPPISINPDKYILKCRGPLHVVRYERKYLFSIVKDCAFAVLDFDHRTESDRQSAVYLSQATPQEI
jgi:SAM-dependent methyltransferase